MFEECIVPASPYLCYREGGAPLIARVRKRGFPGGGDGATRAATSSDAVERLADVEFHKPGANPPSACPFGDTSR